MASDTVPAAAPGPGEPAGNSTTHTPQPPHRLGGLLSAIDPARPTGFTMNPTTENTEPGEPTLTGATSDNYHPTTDTNTSSANRNSGTGNGRGEQRVWRAWMLAGAERWRKGADARNKALDIQKARAQALQVKESRSVNRSEKIVGGSTSAGSNTTSNSGKSIDNKTRQHHSGNGGSGSNGSGGRGGNSGGRGNGGGSGGPGGNGGHRRENSGTGSSQRNGSGNGGRFRPSGPGNGRDGRGGGSHSAGSSGSGPGPGSGGRGSNNSGGGGAGARGPQGPSGPAGGRGPSSSTPRPQTPSAGRSENARQNQAAGSGGRPNTPQRVHTPGDNSGRPWRNPPTQPGATNPNTPNNPRNPQNPNNSNPRPNNQPGNTPPTPPTTNRVSLEKTPTRPTNPPTPSPYTRTPRTQSSRETGYRDGARAAQAANHVIAYSHGVRDGWTDQREHGRREAVQLDQAHAHHTQQRQQPAAPQTPTLKVPPMPTHAPTNTAPQPVQVTGIDATHIQLGTGASRTHISRGEVRTLAGFQRKLAEKTDALTQISERTRALEAHAKVQADRITNLLEQARAVKGGEKLAAALTRLQEAAKVQEGHAAEVRKRAVRAQEACTTVAANTDTRYSGIYQAVIDSPETAPAELSYYRDLGITNA